MPDLSDALNTIDDEGVRAAGCPGNLAHNDVEHLENALSARRTPRRS